MDNDAQAQIDFYKRAAITIDSEVQDILAPALGYPPYAPGEPGYSEDRVNYVTGDHVAQSLAMEAARRIARFELTEFGTVIEHLDHCPVCDMDRKAVQDEIGGIEHHDDLCSGRFEREYVPEDRIEAPLLDPKPWETVINAIARVRTPWPAPEGSRYISEFRPLPGFSQRREDYP